LWPNVFARLVGAVAADRLRNAVRGEQKQDSGAAERAERSPSIPEENFREDFDGKVRFPMGPEPVSHLAETKIP